MKKAWMTGPVLWFVGLALLLVTWAVLDPATLVANFDNDGRSSLTQKREAGESATREKISGMTIYRARMSWVR